MPFWTQQERQRYLDSFNNQGVASEAGNYNVFNERTVESPSSLPETFDSCDLLDLSWHKVLNRIDDLFSSHCSDIELETTSPVTTLGAIYSSSCSCSTQPASLHVVPGSAEGARLLTCWCER
jgi:hypothetical protein